MCLCMCSNIFSKTTGPTEAKFNMKPPWDKGRKFIQMVQVICCQPPLGGGFSRDFTINLSPQCRAFSRALKTEKLKAPLFPGPVGAGTRNDWCRRDVTNVRESASKRFGAGKMMFCDKTVLFLLCWCFMALRHFSGHFGRGQLTPR